MTTLLLPPLPPLPPPPPLPPLPPVPPASTGLHRKALDNKPTVSPTRQPHSTPSRFPSATVASDRPHEDADVCASASKWQPVDPEGKALRAFALEVDSRGDSEERVFPEQHVLFMTGVCLDRSSTSNDAPFRERAILRGFPWFKYRQQPTDGVKSRKSICSARLTQRPVYEAGVVGAAWMNSTRLLVPCPASHGLLRMRASRSNYCWAPNQFRHAPANETAWLSGVTLVGGEAHISNMHRAADHRTACPTNRLPHCRAAVLPCCW